MVVGSVGENTITIKKELTAQIMDDVFSELKGKDGFDDELIGKFRRLVAAGFLTSVDQVLRLLSTTSGESNEDT